MRGWLVAPLPNAGAEAGGKLLLGTLAGGTRGVDWIALEPVPIVVGLVILELLFPVRGTNCPVGAIGALGAFGAFGCGEGGDTDGTGGTGGTVGTRDAPLPGFVVVSIGSERKFGKFLRLVLAGCSRFCRKGETDPLDRVPPLGP